MAGFRALALLWLWKLQIGSTLDVHVSSSLGSDALGDGSVNSPYASIEHAKIALRQLRGQALQEQELRVVIHEGMYPPLSLDPQHDSGTSAQVVTYVGASGETPPVISGSLKIPTSAFTPVGSGPLVRADLFKHGVAPTDLGRMVNGGSIGDCQHEKTDMVFRGERMTLARWPNIKDDVWNFANIDVGGSTSVGVNTSLQPEAARLARWASEVDPWIHGYWTFDWTDSYVGVPNISTAAGMVTMTLQPAIPVKANARFYGVNLLCEVDVPGEYYINHNNGTLYFLPPVPLEDWAPDAVELTIADVVLNISGASYVSFTNINVTNGKGVGVLAKGVLGAKIENVTVSNHGQTGIDIDGLNYRVMNSLVHSTGCVGVKAAGGDVLSLTPGSNIISGNRVHHPALWKRTYMAGILWGGVNNTFSKNVVSDGPHNCFLGGGNEIPAVDCLHEGNVIENCAYEASDTGAWYSCGQSGAWTNRGNVARGNSFKHIRCRIAGRSVEGCGGGVQAVYLDDQISGWLWENNTFEDCDTALFIGGGRSNELVGNHISNSTLAVHFDNRGMGWEKSQCGPDGGSLKDVKAVLNGTAGAKWAQRFPALLNISAGDHLCVPVYNKIINNSYSNVGRFMDASAADVVDWLSISTGNVNATSTILEAAKDVMQFMV